MQNRYYRVIHFAVFVCALLCAVLPALPARAADEPAPKYTFVETGDTLLADYLALVAEHVAALPDGSSNPLAYLLNQYWFDWTTPAALNETELARLQLLHSRDSRMPQLEYFSSACVEWKYSSARGIRESCGGPIYPAGVWRPLLDAYTTGMADADTMYLLWPYYSILINAELDAHIAALPGDLIDETRKAAIAELCVEREYKEGAFMEVLANACGSNAQNWFALACYQWSMGQVDEALQSIRFGYSVKENYWPEPFPLSAIDDCLEQHEIPVPPGKLPSTPEEQEQALAVVGAVCEFTNQLGPAYLDNRMLQELASGGEVILALSGDHQPLDLLASMYQRMGEARRGGLYAELVQSLNCATCSNTMATFAESFDYTEREALLQACWQCGGLCTRAQDAAALLWTQYPVDSIMVATGDQTMFEVLRYSPGHIDHVKGWMVLENRQTDIPPTARLALVAKGRLAELAVCQALRPQFERCLRGFYEEGGEE